MIIREIVLKVTSKCNLCCKYCYVFNQGDTSFLYEPDVMSMDVAINVLKNVNEYCKKHKITDFFIVFHGGEPLLAGKEFYKNFISLSNEIVKSTKIHYNLQTNGTLLSEEWCNLFSRLNIEIGISMDGNKLASVNRVFKNNKEAYEKILIGYNVAKQVMEKAPILSVINTSVNVDEHYMFFKSLKVTYMDCLFPDATYEKPYNNENNLGDWLLKLFDIWYYDNDESKPIIRIFYTIIKLLLGRHKSGCEILGRTDNGVINIKSNGNIEPVDSLKICGNGFTKTKYNIMKHKIDSIKNSDVFYKYYNAHQDNILCEKCNKCIIKDVCGGGLLSHRFSIKNGFDNPSVYCKDLFLLISHIQNVLIDDFPQELIEKTGIKKLTKDDFK